MSRTIVYSLEVFVSFIVSFVSSLNRRDSDEVIVTVASAMVHFMLVLVYNP